MANIEIKRGQQTQVDIKYIPSGETYTKNFFNATTLGSGTNKKFRHKASLVLRRKTNNSVQGEVVDTLTTTDTAGSASSSDLQSTSGRIRFPNVGASNTANANITLHFDTADSDALPNEAITIFGDLKITDVAPDGAEGDTDEVINSFRLTFDIIPEII